VKDGVLQLDEMRKTKVSRQQLFAALRSKNIYNLGEVERVYLEACGLFSIYRKNEPVAGLLLFPPDDPEMNAFGQKAADDQLVCANCGATPVHQQKTERCPVCGADQWGQANISTTLKEKQSVS
jgi:uncharacterized membrane protein YcaP (DUF421 family)